MFPGFLLPFLLIFYLSFAAAPSLHLHYKTDNIYYVQYTIRHYVIYLQIDSKSREQFNDYYDYSACLLRIQCHNVVLLKTEYYYSR